MILEPNFWIIVGILLCTIELFTGFFVSLSFGLAAFLVYALLTFTPDLISNWYILLFVYGAVGLLVSVVLWYFFGKRNTSADIND